jgi:hypothetical protein
MLALIQSQFSKIKPVLQKVYKKEARPLKVGFDSRLEK